MSTHLWVAGQAKADREWIKNETKKSRARFVVEYDLAYDGGGSRWDGYYQRILALVPQHSGTYTSPRGAVSRFCSLIQNQFLRQS